MPGVSKPSRVLILSAHHGELDRRIMAEANALADSGRDVTLVSVPAVVPANCLHPAVHLVLPKQAPTPSRVRAAWHSRPMRPARAILRRVAPRWRVQRSIQATTRFFLAHAPAAGFDAIHCHDLDTLPAAQEVRARRSPGARLIYDSHELYPHQLDDRVFQRLWTDVETQWIRFADLVITVNNAIADQLEVMYGIRRPTVVFNSYGNLRNGDPLAVESFFRHFGVRPGGFRVLFQGSLTRLRNLPSLVRAFAHIDRSCRLFVLGTGPLEAELRRICIAQRITNVAFGGHIPQSELLRYTAHADLGIIPYEESGVLNIRYCTPNKLFEFIEARVPICASMLPELARIVNENGIGATYGMNSPVEIAAAIMDCRERCERGEFARDRREAARDKFAWSGQSRRLLASYEELGV